MEPISTAIALASYAPKILKWITGSDQAEEAAQTVVDIAKKVTGQDDQDKALSAIQADPNLALQFRLSVMNQEAELDKAFLLDRQDARKRDVALVQAGRYNWRSDILAVLAVGGLITCVYFVAKDVDMPERAVNAIMFVAGVLASAVRDVYGFEFGSSRSSKEKDNTIDHLTRGK